MAALSGPNSRRRLGTQSGKIRSEARRVGGRAGQLLMLDASRERLAEGTAVTSAEGNAAFEQNKRLIERGLLETRRRSLLNPEDTRGGNGEIRRIKDLPDGYVSGDAPAAAPQTAQQSRMSFYENQRRSRLGATPRVANAANSTADYRPERDGVIEGLTTANGTAPPASRPAAPAPPPLPARPAAPPREGKINGLPASQVLRHPAGTEPGNMQQVGESLAMGPAAPGPLQSILNAQRSAEPNIPDDPAARAAGVRRGEALSAAANAPKTLIRPTPFSFQRQAPNLAGTGAPAPTPAPAASTKSEKRKLGTMSYGTPRPYQKAVEVPVFGASSPTTSLRKPFTRTY